MCREPSSLFYPRIPGSGGFVPTCHTIMRDLGTQVTSSCAIPVGELQQRGKTTHQGSVCPSGFEKENAHIKQELLQGRNYAISFTHLDLSGIDVEKIHRDSSNTDVYSSYITLAVSFSHNLLPSFVLQGFCTRLILRNS